MIIAIGGFSGSGKTYLAKKLQEKLKCEYLNSDIIRKKLARVDPMSHFYEGFGKGIYSKKMTELTYDYMIKKAKEILQKDEYVIIDATFLSQDMQKKLINSGENYIFIWCEAPEKTIKERIFSRVNKNDNVSDATYEIYLKQKGNFKGLIFPEEKIINVDTTKNIDFENLYKCLIRKVSKNI